MVEAVGMGEYSPPIYCVIASAEMPWSNARCQSSPRFYHKGELPVTDSDAGYRRIVLGDVAAIMRTLAALSRAAEWTLLMEGWLVEPCRDISERRRRLKPRSRHHRLTCALIAACPSMTARFAHAMGLRRLDLRRTWLACRTGSSQGPYLPARRCADRACPTPAPWALLSKAVAAADGRVNDKAEAVIQRPLRPRTGKSVVGGGSNPATATGARSYQAAGPSTDRSNEVILC
jgi:hypothetical protein